MAGEIFVVDCVSHLEEKWHSTTIILVAVATQTYNVLHKDSRTAV